MEQFREALLIAITTPIYAIVIGAEILFSYVHHKNYYSVKGTITNIYLSALNFGLDILLRGFCLLVLNYFFQFHFFQIENIYAYWIVLLLTQDFMYYWLHRIDHYSRFFLAVHVTHN